MTTARLLAGASGYSFKEWKGIFYPEDIKAEEMLPFYGARLPTVEINNTFYRMPRAQVLEDFRFSIKASQRITHMSRLRSETARSLPAICTRTSPRWGANTGPCCSSCRST